MKKFLVFLLFLLMASPSYADLVQRGSPVFPNRDGEFTALLMILDKASLKEFEKPSSEGLHLTKKSKVKRGESFFIKIGFNGMALTKESKADVTYDFKMMNPEGKLIGEESKDLPALHAKIDDPYMVFDNHESDIEIAFDETDKTGVYKVVAIIKDNVGRKRIPLEETIELID